MRRLFLILFSLSLISCASTKAPSTADADKDSEDQKKSEFAYSTLHTGRR